MFWIRTSDNTKKSGWINIAWLKALRIESNEEHYQFAKIAQNPKFSQCASNQTEREKEFAHTRMEKQKENNAMQWITKNNPGIWFLSWVGLVGIFFALLWCTVLRVTLLLFSI